MTHSKRNLACPCGSGKKFKRCHGSFKYTKQIRDLMAARLEAATVADLQRTRQQGLGKPIISTEARGRRLVAVKNRLMASDRWKTFHDFLIEYLKVAMGREWGSAELAKSSEEAHPIAVWYRKLCELQRTFIECPGQVSSAKMTGAVSAYMRLAYDLYSLDHNAELQEKLVNRMRDKDNFEGARYEVSVAASLIRAGFQIEFENEDDRQTTHCEFTATNSKTGRRFSVEAKHRAGNRFRLGRQLNRALSKSAKYPRIVFIDINVPYDGENNDLPLLLKRALNQVRAFEGRKVNGAHLPQAYIFITNVPCHHHLDEIAVPSGIMADGFQIEDFKADAESPTLRHLIEARERHIEMHQLLHSIAEFSDIPATFDGEIPQFAFGDGSTHRLRIGHLYLFPDADGSERVGRLTAATISESEKAAYCGATMEDGTSALYRCPLSDAELEAWERHSDTFFGKVDQRKRSAASPLELYDFFHEGYLHTPRERLLEFMASASDISKLRRLEQPALASIYAERCVYGVLAKQKPEKPV